jgi:hypothetical protein
MRTGLVVEMQVFGDEVAELLPEDEDMTEQLSTERSDEPVLATNAIRCVKPLADSRGVGPRARGVR